MKKIILIAGKARSGKDTFANFLADYLREQGNTVVRDAFAKYIKSYLKDYYGWDGVTKDERIRTKLQLLGTEIIKEKYNYKSFHAKRLAEDFNIFEEDFDYFIVSDTRFRDEMYTMLAQFPDKVVSIKIINDNTSEKLTEEQQGHRSENDLEYYEFDYYVGNNDTLDELKKKACIIGDLLR